MLTIRAFLVFNAFALSGRVDCRCLIPGVSLRSAPGCGLVALSGRVLFGQGVFSLDRVRLVRTIM